MKRQDRVTSYEGVSGTSYEGISGADGEDQKEPDPGADEAEAHGVKNDSNGESAHAQSQRTHTGGNYSPTHIRLANVRAVPLSATRRKIAFTSDHSGELELTLQDSGADTNYRLSVVSSSLGRVKQGRIEQINVLAGDRCILEVELDREFSGAVRVIANAI